MREKMKKTLEDAKKIIVTYKYIFILYTVIFLAIIAVSIMFIDKRFEKSGGANNSGPAIGQTENTQKTKLPQGTNEWLTTLSSCPSGKELFTTFPVKEGDYTAIIPLGNTNPTGHVFPTDHIYVEVFDPQNPALMKTAGRKALISPADMWIFGIQKSEQVGGITDWGMDFSPCRDIKGKFGHVGTISAKLQTEVDKAEGKCDEYVTGGNTYRSCRYEELKIRVKAGEVIGTSGSERSGMLDIWMSDYRETPIKRANESRWDSQLNYVSCFLDYYKPSLTEKYYDLLRGPNNGKRAKEPRCGTTEVDIAGTAQGVWFYNLQGQVRQEDPHLALVFDNLETDKQIFSVGTSAKGAGIPSGTFYFAPQGMGRVNRDFSQVTADGSVYCYNSGQRNGGTTKSILLTMPSAEKLRIKSFAYSCGAGPWTVGDGFVEYDR